MRISSHSKSSIVLRVYVTTIMHSAIYCEGFARVGTIRANKDMHTSGFLRGIKQISKKNYCICHRLTVGQSVSSRVSLNTKGKGTLDL